MHTRHAKEFVFTGWHMLGVITLFFGTVISVNVFMAYQAIRSWSGMVVDNTYVASQEFNAKVAEARKLDASGISGILEVKDGRVRYVIRNAAGDPVDAGRVVARFKRPVGDHQDFQLDLQPAGEGAFEAQRPVSPGHWIVDVSAFSGEARILHHSQRIAVMEVVR